MAGRSPEFRITVESRSLVRVYRGGRITPGTVDAPSGGLADKTITILNQWLTSDKISNRDELVVLGSHLYHVLFRDKVEEAFQQACAEAHADGKILRVILEFAPEAKDLAVWPWEYLYVPDSTSLGFFIARRLKLILSRHVPADLGNDYWREDDETRVLVVVSRPRNADTVQAEPIIGHLRALFPASVDVLEDPTKLQFEERMRGGEMAHIVHFVGHGKFERGFGSLAFVNKYGEAEWMNEQGFAQCFMEARPRLVFLQACEGAGTSSHEALSGIALKLAYNSIPAVIAMRYRVENEHAVRFAKVFYEKLKEGKEIDQAAQDARWALVEFLEEAEFKSRVFGCPVVYLQYIDQDEPRAFRFPATPDDTDRATGTPTEAQVRARRRPPFTTTPTPAATPAEVDLGALIQSATARAPARGAPTPTATIPARDASDDPQAPADSAPQSRPAMPRPSFRRIIDGSEFQPAEPPSPDEPSQKPWETRRD